MKKVKELLSNKITRTVVHGLLYVLFFISLIVMTNMKYANALHQYPKVSYLFPIVFIIIYFAVLEFARMSVTTVFSSVVSNIAIFAISSLVVYVNSQWFSNDGIDIDLFVFPFIVLIIITVVSCITFSIVAGTNKETQKQNAEEYARARKRREDEKADNIIKIQKERQKTLKAETEMIKEQQKVQGQTIVINGGSNMKKYKITYSKGLTKGLLGIGAGRRIEAYSIIDADNQSSALMIFNSRFTRKPPIISVEEV